MSNRIHEARGGLLMWGTQVYSYEGTPAQKGYPFWASQNAFLNKGFNLKSMIWGGLFFQMFSILIQNIYLFQI